MSEKTPSSILEKFGSWSTGDSKRKSRPGFLSLGRSKGAEKAKELSTAAANLPSTSTSPPPLPAAHSSPSNSRDSISSNDREAQAKPEGDGARSALLKFLESNPPLEALQQAAWSLTQKQRTKLIGFLEERIQTDIDPKTSQDLTRQRLMPVLFNLLTEAERDEAIRTLVAGNNQIWSSPSSASASSSSPNLSAYTTQKTRGSVTREKSSESPKGFSSSSSAVPRIDTNVSLRPRKVSEVNLLEFLQSTSPRKVMYQDAKGRLDMALNRRNLIDACITGDTNAVEGLLAADLDPNFTVEGETPLLVAVKQRSIEVVRLLLSGDRANVNMPNEKKEFALVSAVGGSASSSGLTHSSEEILVKLLLESPSIDVHVADSEGNTALHRACRQGNIAIAQLLLRAGSDSTRSNKAGRNSAEIAADAGHVEVCWLIKNFNPKDSAALKKKKSLGTLFLGHERRVNPARIRSKLQLLAEKLYGSEKVPKEVEQRLDNVVSLVELVQVEDEARKSRDPSRATSSLQSLSLSNSNRSHIRSESEQENMRRRQLIKRDSVVDLIHFLKVEPISHRPSGTYRMKAQQEEDEIDYNYSQKSATTMASDAEGSVALVKFLKADRPPPDEETIKSVANIIFPSDSSNPDRLAKARTVIDLVDFLYQSPQSSADSNTEPSAQAQGMPPLTRRDSVVGFLEFLQSEAPPIRRAASVLRKKPSKANSLRRLTSSILRRPDLLPSQEPEPEPPRPWLGRSLQEYYALDQSPIPTIIAQCISFLVDHGALKVEGIFRLSPESPEDLELLINAYNDGGKFELRESTDVHVVTRFLKLWLRSLPEPLLPDFEDFAELNHENDLNVRLVRAKSLVESLPPQNKFILRAFLDFCFLILGNTAENLMDADSLANALSAPLCESGPSLPPGEQFRRSAAAKLFLAFLIPRTDKLFTEGLVWSPRLVANPRTSLSQGDGTNTDNNEGEDTISISESSRSEIVAVIENTSLISDMSGEEGRRLGDLIEFIEFLDDAPIIPLSGTPSPLSQDELHVPDLPQWKPDSSQIQESVSEIPSAAFASLPSLPKLPETPAKSFTTSSSSISPFFPSSSSSPSISYSPGTTRSLSRSTAKRTLLPEFGKSPSSESLVAPPFDSKLFLTSSSDSIVFLKSEPQTSQSSPVISTLPASPAAPRRGSQNSHFQFPRSSTLSVMQIGKALSEIEIQLYMILDSPEGPFICPKHETLNLTKASL